MAEESVRGIRLGEGTGLVEDENYTFASVGSVSRGGRGGVPGLQLTKHRESVECAMSEL